MNCFEITKYWHHYKWKLRRGTDQTKTMFLQVSHAHVFDNIMSSIMSELKPTMQAHGAPLSQGAIIQSSNLM
jgi:hypothetical protein